MLEALAACVAESGIHGLTVQAVADRSGWSRGHVRHYLGNKADQLQSLVALYTERYASSLEQIVEHAELGRRRAEIFHELFGDTWQNSNAQDDVVLDELTAYAASNPGSGVTLTPMYQRIRAAIEIALLEAFEPAEAGARADIALALAYGLSSMIRIQAVGRRACAEHAAVVLGLPPEVAGTD
ncbi:hypothetical protein ASE14_14250 [Agromyces sp. Root81]|uniref:TetR/AcrR family transcriptional regulator n=1 Tax=Agromyces sp. Root81 TaxID=1736601 RepID=UPI0006F5C867|nr:TetR/AcrR family transcriptional regulator [Agromyces sp. Root81]KRC61936.1 hypothetical protein ASE14_14250 [Agromyces sp. Root81]